MAIQIEMLKQFEFSLKMDTSLVVLSRMQKIWDCMGKELDALGTYFVFEKLSWFLSKNNRIISSLEVMWL